MKQNLVIGEPQFSEETDSAAVTEPITLAEAKKYLRISDDETFDDALIAELTTTARKQCEHFLCISLIERTVTVQLQNELGGIWLPYGPVGDFGTMYRIGDAVLEEIEENEITTESYYTQGRLFKQLFTPNNCRVQVSYAAGYSRLPTQFKTAILQQLAFLYENRGDAQLLEQLSPMVIISLKNYRRVG